MKLEKKVFNASHGVSCATDLILSDTTTTFPPAPLNDDLSLYISDFVRVHYQVLLKKLVAQYVAIWCHYLNLHG